VPVDGLIQLIEKQRLSFSLFLKFRSESRSWIRFPDSIYLSSGIDFTRGIWQISEMSSYRNNLFSTIVFNIMMLIISGSVSGGNLTELRPERAGGHLRSVCFAPGTHSAWAVGFEGSILKTADGGRHWHRQDAATSQRLYDVQALNENLVFACGTSGTLLVTDTGGNRWQSLGVPTRKRLVGVFFLDRNSGWVVGDDGYIAVTHDGGTSWKSQESGVPSGLRLVWFKNRTNGYVFGYQGVALGTSDGGSHWIPLNAPVEFSSYGAEFSDSGNQIFVAGSFGLVCTSMDGGDSWKFIPPVTTNFLRDVRINDKGRLVAVGYGWILSCDPGNPVWEKVCHTGSYNLQSVDFGAGGVGVAVGRWGIIYTTNDHGETWIADTGKISPDLSGVAFNEAGYGVASGADGYVMISDDSGRTWTCIPSGIRSNLNAVAHESEQRFAVVGENGACLISDDAGGHWQSLNVTGDRLRAICFTGQGKGFLAGDHGLMMKTIDGGMTWSNHSLNRQENITEIVFVSTDHGWILGSDGLIMETRDSGQTWIAQYTGISSDFDCGGFRTDGYSLAGGTDGNILESVSGGTNSSWYRLQLDRAVSAIETGCAVLGLIDGSVVLPDRSILKKASPMDAPIRGFARIDSAYIGVGDRGRVIHVELPH
jgi:photosystem II stability/assembly factor-like uncharacterized protein